jgi:hypothetical protein
MNDTYITNVALQAALNALKDTKDQVARDQLEIAIAQLIEELNQEKVYEV